VVVGEHEADALACPAGKVIKSIPFAAFGTPTGSCPGQLAHDPKCDAANVSEILSTACIGLQRCPVEPHCDHFICSLVPGAPTTADPCNMVVKHLDAKVECEQ